MRAGSSRSGTGGAAPANPPAAARGGRGGGRGHGGNRAGGPPGDHRAGGVAGEQSAYGLCRDAAVRRHCHDGAGPHAAARGRRGDSGGGPQRHRRERRTPAPGTGGLPGAERLHAGIGRNPPGSRRRPLGQQIKIRGVTLTGIGVVEPKGATGFFDRDDVVFVPLTTAQRRLFGIDYVRTIYVQVTSPDAMPDAQTGLGDLLRQRHRLGPTRDDDFSVRSQADVLQAFTGVSRTMTLLLGGIAAVWLIVGGIGIMNIMLVSVTERTREIGIRKAVGARMRDILVQFLIESVALSVSGGIVGILLGIVGSRLITRLAGWATLISPQAVLLAFSFAVAVGVFFGLYPAQRAARLDPIEALRHE